MNLTRRHFFQTTAAGFALPAFADLMAREESAQQLPLLPSRVKRVIFLFMYGGPSSIDTFDYKPQLIKDHGKPLPFNKPRLQFAKTQNLFKSPWEFKQYGESGTWVSDLFPHVAQHADKLTFIHSLHGSNPAHGGALLKIHTGTDTFVRPSMGAWISYGLGSENSNLPSFVTIDPILNHGGVQNYGAAFLPAQHQGVRVHGKNLSINDLNPSDDQKLQESKLDLLRQLNAQQFGGSPELEARIRSFELAFQMQREAPEALDLGAESAATNQLYGIGERRTSAFGRQCLLARRLAERGVRFIQCTHREGDNITWDDHSKIVKHHPKLAANVDKPIAGLLADLDRRGLLEDTLVMWGGEFGRTPVAETGKGATGRDHNPHGFTWWMAGGGLKPGFHFGSTDEYGYYAVEDRVHIHDLHATILHMLGLDHEKLTWRHSGRDFRLTDVHGRVINEILA